MVPVAPSIIEQRSKQVNGFKRGSRIEYTYAAGDVVPGRIVRPAGENMKDWFVCELTDKGGSYRGTCHASQLRIIGNR
jgi:hypothetical protein